MTATATATRMGRMSTIMSTNSNTQAGSCEGCELFVHALGAPPHDSSRHAQSAYQHHHPGRGLWSRCAGPGKQHAGRGRLIDLRFALF